MRCKACDAELKPTQWTYCNDCEGWIRRQKEDYTLGDLLKQFVETNDQVIRRIKDG